MNWFYNLPTAERGIIGSAVSTGSVLLSFVAHVEAYLRVAGLLVGLCVGVATLTSVCLDIRAKRRRK